MEEIKSLTYRAEEALVKAMEANEAEPMVLAELGKAFAAVVTAGAPASTLERLPELLNAIEDM